MADFVRQCDEPYVHEYRHRWCLVAEACYVLLRLVSDRPRR
ncbi:hypothetical protein [Kineococcus xinjiangensis]|nr:hypothetical protein [Kineococcus xinjiangensis]